MNRGSRDRHSCESGCEETRPAYQWPPAFEPVTKLLPPLARPYLVIPAQAGIQGFQSCAPGSNPGQALGPRFRGGDEFISHQVPPSIRLALAILCCGVLLAGCNGSTLDAIYPGSFGHTPPPAVGLPAGDCPTAPTGEWDTCGV